MSWSPSLMNSLSLKNILDLLKSWSPTTTMPSYLSLKTSLSLKNILDLLLSWSSSTTMQTTELSPLDNASARCCGGTSCSPVRVFSSSASLAFTKSLLVWEQITWTVLWSGDSNTECWTTPKSFRMACWLRSTLRPPDGTTKEMHTC